MIKRLMCAILVAALAAALWHIAAVTYDPMYGAIDEETMIVELDKTVADDNTLTIWYTDEALTDYLSSVALSFQQNQNIKVNVVLKSGIEFLESINSVSIADESERTEAMPDLYITSHNNLLRAYLAGIASEIQDPEGIVDSRVFSDTALNAVTCYGKLVAYPLYYETNFFLYNKTYMAMIAQNKIETEMDKIQGEEAQAQIDSSEESAPVDDGDKAEKSDLESAASADSEEESSDELDSEEFEDPMGEEDASISQEVRERLANMIPTTMEDVMTFANNYDAPEKVEAVLKWDVTDIFYNYFFVGNYMDVGGKAGDNAAAFNIYNSQSVECLKSYQDLNQFFEFDSKTDTYNQILQDFIDGKLVFTVATTDAVAKLERAKSYGEFEFDYGITNLPDIDKLLKTKGLSVTSVVAVNGYSDKQEKANLLGTYIVNEKSLDLYSKSGKIACNKLVQYDDEEIPKIMDEYEKSVPLPKMVETANFWVQLEIAFTKVWNGADPDETLRELSDTIGAQIETIRVNLPMQESFTAGGGSLIQ